MGEHTGRMVSEYMTRQAARDEAGLNISANDRQIGGSHYKTNYEHWDFVREVLGNNYLMGNATKYISRWRKKNGLEDLHKSLHYIDKALETRLSMGTVHPTASGGLYTGQSSGNVTSFFRFCISAECGLLEAQAIWHVMMCEWEAAADTVKQLIATEEAK